MAKGTDTAAEIAELHWLDPECCILVTWPRCSRMQYFLPWNHDEFLGK